MVAGQKEEVESTPKETLRRKVVLNAASTVCSTSSMVDVDSESIAEPESDSETKNLDFINF